MNEASDRTVAAALTFMVPQKVGWSSNTEPHLFRVRAIQTKKFAADKRKTQ